MRKKIKHVIVNGVFGKDFEISNFNTYTITF